MTVGLDFAGGRPGGAAIKAAGYDYVVRYLSDGGAGLPGKQLLPWEADDLRANAVEIVSNWETYANRMLEGWSAGVADANAGLAQVLACGGSKDRPIYFSADWDATDAQQAQIDDYLRGAASVLGVENVGVYGGYWVVKRCLDNGTARWAWQTDAWSGGNLESRAQLHQLIGFVDVAGVICDKNEANATDYGQWSLAGNTPQEATVTFSQADIEAITASVTAAATKWLSEFIIGFVSPIGSDVKDIKEQLTGTRNTVYNADGTVNNAASYPGWAQLGHRTVVDAIAAAAARNGVVGATDINPTGAAK